MSHPIDFYNAQDFEVLKQFAGQKKNGSEAHNQAYAFLRNTYKKNDYWARQVCQRVFGGSGVVKIRKKPTNQGQYFEVYHWAKIYPSPEHQQFRLLSYTLGIDTDDAFVIKIDTVSADSETERIYEEYRGDYDSSPIVRIHKKEEILALDWDGLIEMTADIIRSLGKDFDAIYKALQKEPMAAPANPDTALPTSVAPGEHLKNVILYGPPGTGKTYHSIDLAVQILGLNTGNHTQNQRIFKEQLGNQIEFVTFHQNYSYEDFIQGLKPDTEGGNGQLSFKLRDGIFKQIADRALHNYKNATARIDEPQVAPFDQVFGQFVEPLLEGTVTEIPVQMREAAFTITEVTDVLDGSVRFRNQRNVNNRTLSIRTLRELYEDKRTYSSNGRGVYYYPLLEKLRSLGKHPHNGNDTREPFKNYVIVIDEINRANISRVFGELITLIEEDKRYGGANEMTVKLPSGSYFTVPPNLHIIGTMNTADRSIALLDIALRRRFKFIGKYPDYQLIQDFERVLRPINEQIKIRKKSADLMIGHSFFIGKEQEQLHDIFDQEIIPLLNEYFNGNNAQIIEVLRAGGIRAQEDENFQLTCERN